MTDYIEWPTANSTGFMVAHEGDGLVMERLNRARGTVQNQITPTITCGTGGGTGTVTRQGGERMTDTLRVRYLTPRECLRLMGQSDDAIDRLMAAEPTKTAQYRMAGNSIVVDVLEAIFKGIYIDETFEEVKGKQMTLGDFA